MAVLEDPRYPDKSSFIISPTFSSSTSHGARTNLVTVVLKDTRTKEQKYQMTFDTSKDVSVAKRFLHVLEKKRNHKYPHSRVEATVLQDSSNYDKVVSNKR